MKRVGVCDGLLRADCGRQGGIHGKHVQPGNMICDEQASLAGADGLMTDCMPAHVQYVRQGSRPVLKDAPLRGLAQGRVNAGDPDCVEHMEKQARGTKADYRQSGGFAVHLLEVMFAVHERQLRPVRLVLPHAAAFGISARMMPGKIVVRCAAARI